MLTEELHERLEEHGSLLQGRCRMGRSNFALANNAAGYTPPADAEYAALQTGKDGELFFLWNSLLNRRFSQVFPRVSIVGNQVTKGPTKKSLSAMGQKKV